MKFKEYEMSDGIKAVFEYDENGVGKITLECMDMLMGQLIAYKRCIQSRSFWDAKHCDGCIFYDDCPFNPREDEDEPNCSEKPNNCEDEDIFEYCPRCGMRMLSKWYEPKDEPTTQTETQNSNLTFEKDECAKEYEELGLKELKELINADRKTENCSEKPNNCEPQMENLFTDKYGDVWEWRGDAWHCISGEDEPQTDTEIAKAIVHKMIDDAVIAEDAYPDLRQKMHDAVDEYEPQTDCAWK